jgi:hypothetical protein
MTLDEHDWRWLKEMTRPPLSIEFDDTRNEDSSSLFHSLSLSIFLLSLYKIKRSGISREKSSIFVLYQQSPKAMANRYIQNRSRFSLLSLLFLMMGILISPNVATATFVSHSNHRQESPKLNFRAVNTQWTNAHRKTAHDNDRHIHRDAHRRFVSAPLGILTGLTTSATVAAAFFPSLPLDPLVTTEILNDMSHLTLDVASFLNKGLLGVRIAAIAGRLCTIAADFLPDHSMFPEEIIFQMFMLAVAVIGLGKAAVLPIFAALHTNVQIRDGKTYDALFASVGVSWTQFKAISMFAMDWVDLREGETITSFDGEDEHQDNDDHRDYMYWLYSGSIAVEHSSNISYEVQRASGPKRSHECGRAVIGENRLLSHLRKKHIPQAASESSSSSFTIRANAPSTVLRINAAKLQILMENDSHLAESIRIWLYQSMEAKWNARMHQPEVVPSNNLPFVRTANATVSY